MSSTLDNTDILNTVQPVSAENVQAAVEKLQMLAEPINGPNSFNLETAAYGYITREERLIIPGSLKANIPTTITQTVQLNINQLLGIAMYNYVRMRKYNLSEDHALYIALYRARLISLGYLLRDKEDRKVSVDEVDYSRAAKDPHTIDYDNVAAYKEAFDKANNDREMMTAAFVHSSSSNFKSFLGLVFSKANILEHVTLVATQLAASTYLVFRQMGHHYKPELEGKYSVLWKATTLETHNFMPSNAHLHRTAIHSFGVYALHEKFFQNKEASLLAETYMDRSDVTPCGVAVINTCWASIKLMQSLPLWGSLYAAYKEQIDTLQNQASRLKDAKSAIRFHKNAKLFGVTREYLDPTSAYALAPVAKGFLQSMDEDADIKRQKSLDKRANQNPLAVTLIQNVIITVMNKIQNEGNIAKALPAPEASVREVEEVS